MKRATLTRGITGDEGTFGALELEGGPLLRSTELPWRNNAKGSSCIPPGTYRCVPFNSPKHGRVYLLQDVPGRSLIEIHVANFGGDTAKGWRSELLGCIAPAMNVGVLQNRPGGPMQRAGVASGEAMAKLMAWAGGEPFELVIR